MLLDNNPIHMSIHEIINEECVAHIKHITTSPFLRCNWPKFWKQVNASSDVNQWDDTADVPTITVMERLDFVHQMVSIWGFRECSVPLDIDEMFWNFSTPIEHNVDCLLWQGKHHAYPANTVS